jgi:SHS2 domain-containing protein
MENKKYTKKFKFLEHTADMKFQAFGKNENELFENSVLALKEVICGKIKVKKKIKKEIEVKGKDWESLLYNFLEEVIFLLDTENFLISKVKIRERIGFRIKATLYGDRVSDYKFTNNVKAVTYNEMFVGQIGKIWECQVVIDV